MKTPRTLPFQLSMAVILLLLFMPAGAGDEDFAPIETDGEVLSFHWTEDTAYSLNVPSIWPEAVCYATQRAILLTDPDNSDSAWYIRFGSRLLSFGAESWANERHLSEEATEVKVRCFPLARIRQILRRAEYWNGRPEDDFVVAMHSCSLLSIDRNPCPVGARKPAMCEGWWILLRRARQATDLADRVYWNNRWEEWIEEHRPGYLDRIRDAMTVSIGFFLYFAIYGSPCNTGSLPL